MKVTFKNWVCDVWFSKYMLDDSLFIGLTDAEDGSPIAVATVCVGHVKPREGCVLIKNYAENEGILEALVAAKIIDYPQAEYKISNYAWAQECKLLVTPVLGGKLS